MFAACAAARINTRFRRVAAAAARGMLPAAVVIAALLTAGSGHAQTLVTWSGTGGNTSWSTANNWTAGGPPTTTGTWGLTVTGTNQAVAGTLTMTDDIGGTSSAVTLSGLSIVSTASTAYIISRGDSRTFTLINGGTISTVNASNSRSRIGVPITLSGSATFDLANDLQLDGGLTGGSTFTKSGNGILFFQNNFSQNVNFTGGQIYMNSGVASGTITFNGGSGFVAGNGNSSAQFAFLQNGQVRAWGGATAVFTSSTFNLPSAAASDVTFTLNSASTGTSAIQGVIQDNISKKLTLLLNGSGSYWRLSGSNSYSGGTTINSFVNLIADNGSALGRGLVTANGNLNVNGLTLTVNGLAGTTGVIGSATTASVLAVDTTGQSTTFSGTIQNGSGTMGLTVLGTGTLAISGSNTHSGATNVNAGTLRLANQNSVQNSTVTMGGGSLVFDSAVIGNAFTFGGLSGTSSGAGYDIALRNNAGTPAAIALTVGGNNASTTYAGALSGSGSLTKTGSGTLTLSGSNTYSGVTTASGGVLQFATPASLYSGSTASWTAANIKTGTGATLAVNVGTSNFTSANVTTLLTNLGGLGGSVNNNGLQAGAAIGFDTSNAGGSFTIADAIKDSTGTGGGAIGLVKLGSGTLVLTGSSGYTGATAVNAGTLQIGSGTTGMLASTSPISVASGATLAFNRTDAYGGNFSNAVSGAGGVAVLSGTLALSGSNAYTGGTQINAGVVQMGNAYALSGNGANVTIASGAMLDLAGVSGTTAARYNLTLSGSGVGNLGAITNTAGTAATLYLASGTLAGDTLIKSQGRNLNIDSTSGISGTSYALTFDTPWPMVVTGTVNVGSLVKIGSLALELSTAGSPGSTQINNGSLILRQQFGTGTVSLGDTIGSNSTTLNLATGASFSNPIVVRAGNSGTASIDNYTNWAPVLSGTLTLNKDVVLRNTSTNNTGWTISGGIGGSGGITILNSGTVTAPITLSGSNTFTGTTTMSSANPGTLQVGHVWALQNSTLDTGSAGNQSVAFTAAGTNTYVLGGLRGSDDLAIGANSIDVGRNNASTTYAAAISGAGGLTKSGAGTLTLSGSNTYSGVTTISAGMLSFGGTSGLQGTSGVTINGGAGLTYTGGAANFGKNVTVTAGSGTGTITNSGGGTLTLSGNLSKDNSVLRLTGGSFNVTGLITGTTVGASDLVVDAASVTLSNTNSYNGPTYVYNSGTLALGIDNAIPNTSAVTLGNATTRGTLVTGTFTDSISQLIFSGSGGTVSLSGDKTASAQLATAGSLTLGSNASLVLTNAGTSAGLYRLISATSISGSFASSNVTGTSAAYQILTTSTSVDYQQRAVLGAVAVTNPAAAIITGGSSAFTYSVTNTALSGGTALSVTGAGLANVIGTSSGTAASGNGSTGSLSGLVFTGTGIGNNQQSTFTVNAPAAFGQTSTTGTVSVTVLDHATSSLAGSLLTSTTISLGTWNYATNQWEGGGSGTGLFNIFNIASSFGAQLTADLALLGVSGTANGFSTNLNTFTDIAGGGTRQYSIFTNTSGWTTSGLQTATFTLSMGDKVGMAGATTSNTLSVTAQVIVVPEPGAIALAGIGIAGAAWALQRRRRVTPTRSRRVALCGIRPCATSRGHA
ncbi:MAG: autotransporter-associated beta strand repeat-containing protein [Planctomycetia bacterium]